MGTDLAFYIGVLGHGRKAGLVNKYLMNTYYVPPTIFMMPNVSGKEITLEKETKSPDTILPLDSRVNVEQSS